MTNQILPERNSSEFGQILKKERIKRRLSRTDLAKRVGIVRGNIKKYEDGDAVPRESTVELLEKVFQDVDAPYYGYKEALKAAPIEALVEEFYSRGVKNVVLRWENPDAW